MDGPARFDELCDDLLARNGDLELTKMMGMPRLKRNGKLVAGLAACEDAMVSNLDDPAAHTGALALGGARLLDPSSRGRPFKESDVVPPAHAAHWQELADAARA
jgi:hypothetical protein